jgi:transcriptional regulator with XRE-family HTH domain
MELRKNQSNYEQLLEEEQLILSATELIHELLEERGVSRSRLAELIGKSRGHVSQLLDGRRNMTLRTLARLAYALDHRITLQTSPVGTQQRLPNPVLASLDAYLSRANVQIVHGALAQDHLLGATAKIEEPADRVAAAA